MLATRYGMQRWLVTSDIAEQRHIGLITAHRAHVSGHFERLVPEPVKFVRPSAVANKIVWEFIANAQPKQWQCPLNGVGSEDSHYQDAAKSCPIVANGCSIGCKDSLTGSSHNFGLFTAAQNVERVRLNELAVCTDPAAHHDGTAATRCIPASPVSDQPEWLPGGGKRRKFTILSSRFPLLSRFRLWIGVQKGPRYGGDRRLKGTPISMV